MIDAIKITKLLRMRRCVARLFFYLFLLSIGIVLGTVLTSEGCIWGRSHIYGIDRSLTGHVISISLGYHDKDSFILDGPYVIFLENGGQIEYLMKNNKRNGQAVKRLPNGEIEDTIFFQDDMEVKK